MAAKKTLFKKADELPKQQSTEELNRFTLPSPEENTSPETKNNTMSFSPSLAQTSSKESIFWHTRKGKIWMSVFGASIVLALVAGLFMYREGATLTPSPTPAEKPQVSPTPTPEAVDLPKYKIEVLNGNGIQGEAAKLKKQLETEKFTVSSIDTADRLNYQKTVIQAKKTVPKKFLDKLKSFLEKEYILDDIKELPDNEKSDVVVIIGSKSG